MPQGSRRRTLELEAGTPGHHPCTSLPFTGTYVTRAEATDADDPETDNAALRYSILEQGGPLLFSIDPLTGEIRTVQVGLDREVRPPGCASTAGQGGPDTPGCPGLPQTCPVGGCAVGFRDSVRGPQLVSVQKSPSPHCLQSSWAPQPGLGPSKEPLTSWAPQCLFILCGAPAAAHCLASVWLWHLQEILLDFPRASHYVS